MKTTTIYLDEVTKVIPDIKNDSRLAETLGISRQAVSQYRKGTAMSVIVAVRIARILQLDPIETISATMAEQANTVQEKEFWKAEYKKAYTD